MEIKQYIFRNFLNHKLKFKSPNFNCSYKLLKYQMKILGFKNKINLIKLSDLEKKLIIAL